MSSIETYFYINGGFFAAGTQKLIKTSAVHDRFFSLTGGKVEYEGSTRKRRKKTVNKNRRPVLRYGSHCICKKRYCSIFEHVAKLYDRSS